MMTLPPQAGVKAKYAHCNTHTHSHICRRPRTHRGTQTAHLSLDQKIAHIAFAFCVCAGLDFPYMKFNSFISESENPVQRDVIEIRRACNSATPAQWRKRGDSVRTLEIRYEFLWRVKRMCRIGQTFIGASVCNRQKK